MPPPTTKSKGNYSPVKEITDISVADGDFLNNVDNAESQNKFISSTPALDNQAGHSKQVKRNHTKYDTLPNYQRSDSESSRDSSSKSRLHAHLELSRNRPLEDCFSTTAHLEGSRSLFCNPNTSYLDDIQKGSRFDLTTFTKFESKSASSQNASNIRSSPFYAGRTMYGGASSASYTNISERLSSSIKKKSPAKSAIQIHAIKPNVPDSNQSQMSQTARRILDALEQFAKPISESPKAISPGIPTLIQNAKRFGHQERLYNKSQEDLSRSTALANKPYSRLSNLSSINKNFKRELQVATVPDLLRMRKRERLQESTQAVRQLATTSTSDLIKPNINYTLRTEDNVKNGSKSTNKVKTRVTKTRPSRNDIDQQDIVPAFALPSVQLPITDMPKFDIKLSGSNKSTTFSNIGSKSDRLDMEFNKDQGPFNNLLTPKMDSKALNDNVKNSMFKFTSPIKIDNASTNLLPCNNFKFSVPINIVSDNPKSNDVSKFDTSKNKTSKKPELENLMSVKANEDNKVDKRIETESNDAIKSNTCSIKSRFAIANTTKTVDKSFQDFVKKQNSKWECTGCLTRNDQDKSKCVCCGAPKSGLTFNKPQLNTSLTKINSIPASTNSFQELIKKQNQKWECSGCMTRNDQNLSKCLCCESPKPGAMNKSTVQPICGITTITPTSFTPTVTATTNSFQDLVKKQNFKWECNGCMTRNDQNKSKCACCEAPKPGEVPEKAQFNFSSVPVTEFKFGMDKASAEPTKAIPSTNSFVTSINVVATTTTSNFTFGMPSSHKSEDKTEVNKKGNEVISILSQTNTKINATDKTPFTFGIPSIKTENTTPEVKTCNIANTASKNETPIADKSKTIYQFGSLVTNPLATKAELPTVFSILPENQSNISTANSTVISSQTTTTVANSIFSFGSNAPVSTNFNGGSNDKIKIEKKSSTPTTSLFSMTKQLNSSVAQSPTSFKTKNEIDPDNSGPPSKKPVFTFGSNPSTITESKTSSIFGTNSKVPTSGLSEIKSSEAKFQFGSSASSNTEQIKPFSFSSNNTAGQKTSLFVFGSSGGTTNNATSSATPFSFGGGQAQQPVLGFNKTNNDTFGSNQSIVLPTGGFGSTVNSQLSAPAFGSGSTLNHSASTFSFGTNSAQPVQGSAVFTFGSNKASSDPPATGGFNFNAAPQGSLSSLGFSSDGKAPNLTFSMGSAGSQAPRKIKKAVRRNPR